MLPAELDDMRRYEGPDSRDAVREFQQDGYVMTDAEARALSDTSQRNRPSIPVKSLPVRR